MSRDKPVDAVDAATVILVRPGQTPGAPWECFMVRRHVRSEFAADVYVFPGGKVDPADCVPEMQRYVQGVPSGADSHETGSSTEPALRLAAIRELFEEAGVLLASRPGGKVLRLEGQDGVRFAELRRRLQAGELSILEIARAENLRFAIDLLHPFSRWITPESLPRRYDTRFFVAAMPPGQTSLHDALETTDSVWIAPAEALDRSRLDQFPLVFATEQHLARMARFGAIDDLLAGTTPADVEPIMPRIVQRGSETVFLLPGDEGY